MTDISDKLKKRINVAMGREPGDTLFKNATIVDTFSQSTFSADIAVSDGIIAAPGKNFKGIKEIDCKGKYIIPGLIDAHLHIESSLSSPDIFARAVTAKGTTAVIADPHEIANVCGISGIKYILDSTSDIPLSVYLMLPSCVPAVDFENAGAILNVRKLSTLINEERILGLAEMMNYPGVINNDPDVIEKLSLCIKNKKIIDGHSPMLSGKKLAAYISPRIATDHECSTIEEMLEKIRLGMYVLIREGSAVRNLATLVKGVTAGNFRRCMFCTDDKHADDIIENGHIDNNLRKAVSCGLDPIMAVTMATLNPAECYRLYNKGAIAPGFDADLLIVDNLSDFNVDQVFVRGVKVAENGKSIYPVSDSIHDKSAVTDTVRLKPFDKSDLLLKPESRKANIIRVLQRDVVTKAVTREVSLDATNYFQYNPELDILKIAVFERHNKTGNIGVGLIENYGLKHGAIASSIAHDSHNIVAVGANDEDICAAVRNLADIGGGISICNNRKLLQNIPLPIAGLMTDKGLDFVSKKIESMRKTAFDILMVNPNIDPFMTLGFITLPVIPEIRLTDQGLFDVRSFSFIKV